MLFFWEGEKSLAASGVDSRGVMCTGVPVKNWPGFPPRVCVCVCGLVMCVVEVPWLREYSTSIQANNYSIQSNDDSCFFLMVIFMPFAPFLVLH